MQMTFTGLHATSDISFKLSTIPISLKGEGAFPGEREKSPLHPIFVKRLITEEKIEKNYVFNHSRRAPDY